MYPNAKDASTRTSSVFKVSSSMSTEQEIPFGPDQTPDDVCSAENVSPEGLRRVYLAAIQRIDAVSASLQEIIDLSRLEGAEEAYKRCYKDLSKLSETRYDDILRAIGSHREETKALRQTVGLEYAAVGTVGMPRAPFIPERARHRRRLPEMRILTAIWRRLRKTSKLGSIVSTD